MTMHNHTHDEHAGFGEPAIEDIGDCGCGVAMAKEPEPAPQTGWMGKVDKLADLVLPVSIYLFYPVILVIIFIDVIGRNFFASPLSWAIEGSGLFLIGAIFLAVPRVELDRSHILLDILYDKYPPKMKLLCDAITRSFAFLWMVGATIRSSMEIPTSFALNESGSDFNYPFWPMRVVMTISFAVLALALLYNVAISIQRLCKGGQK